MQSQSIWSDARGLFLLVSVAPGRNDHGELTGGGTRLHANDGSGWRLLLDEPFDPDAGVQNQGRWYPNWTALTGVPAGPLVLSGTTGPCGVELIDGAQSTCTLEMAAVNQVFVVNATRAYAIEDDRVWVFDGSAWSLLGKPLTPVGGTHARAVWANDEIVVVVADKQQIYLYRPGDAELTLQPAVPGGDYRAVWGFGAKDIWAGTAGGQLMHYDGSAWSVVARQFNCPQASNDGVEQLWGDEIGNLYVRTPHTLSKRVGESFERLLSVSDCQGGAQLTGLWGNSASEIFVALRDPAQSGTPCGASFVVWYDGNVFRRL